MSRFWIETGKGSKVGSEFGAWVKAKSGEGLYHLAADDKAEKTKCSLLIKSTWTRLPRLTWWPPISRPKRKTCVRCRPLK